MSEEATPSGQALDDAKSVPVATDWNESRLAELMMQAPAFIAVLRGADHVFEFVNKAYLQLVGHRDITGKPVLEAIPEVRGQGYMELLDSVYQTGREFAGNEMSLLLQRKPNAPLELRYVNFVYQAIPDGAGGVDGIFVHGVDVTDLVAARQKTEQLAAQIALQARTFDTTLAAIQDFVYTFDRSGRFTYSNAPLLNLLGITLAEIIGQSFHDLPYPKALADTLQAYIAKVVATGEPIRDETPYTNPTGHLGYYEYIFVPIFGANGEVELVAGSTREISHFKQLQQQKDEFIGVASHELKTPVTSIKAYAQLLRRRFARENNFEAADLVGKMDAQLNKLNGLIGDLLDVTKIDAGKLQFHPGWFDFNALVNEIVDEMQPTTVRHLLVKNLAPPKSICADRDRVGQAITNFLSNAIKYSPDSDRVVVTSENADREVTLRVQDFGVGLSEDDQRRVFDRFFRASESNHDTVPGMGLGLYISAEIIRRSGGRIWAEGQIGQGSIFCFSLPVDWSDLQPTGESLNEAADAP